MRRDDARLPASGHLQMYGSEAPAVQAFVAEDPGRAAALHPRLPYICGQVLWAAHHEMARTVEDVLARRTRSLLLDARASIEAAPRVAELLAAVLHRDQTWITSQVADYTALARGYLP
jgi:glycerol-3-phosphate dehydrogenase